MFKVKDVVAAMERIAPPVLAMQGDPIGLHSGSLEKKTAKIVVALDASLEALQTAKKKKADMLVVHHPRFYHSLATLADHDPAGFRGAEIARSGLAVYSAHTNLDNAFGGVNDCLAAALGLENTAVLRPEYRERLLKLAVFVPASHVDKVLKALTRAGAGAIGEYTDCTFRARGTGTFRGKSGTKPFIGTPGVLEEADEYRLETVFGEFAADRILEAMLASHPYEEAAYDLYPLLGWAGVYGVGRVGCLPQAVTLDQFAKQAARATRSKMAQCIGKSGKKVKKIAVWGGAGVDVKAILATGADCLAAGEASYHDLEVFAEKGMAVVTLGHGYSENVVLKPLAARLKQELPGLKVELADSPSFQARNVFL